MIYYWNFFFLKTHNIFLLWWEFCGVFLLKLQCNVILEFLPYTLYVRLRGPPKKKYFTLCVVTVWVFVCHMFSYHPFYFDFHSARVIFDVSSGYIRDGNEYKIPKWLVLKFHGSGHLQIILHLNRITECLKMTTFNIVFTFYVFFSAETSRLLLKT
jgi:hypothetical protein